MNSEIAMLKGQLADAEKVLRRLLVVIDGDKSTIRGYMPVYATDEDLLSINTDAALETMKRLHENVQKAQGVTKQIRSLKEALGEE
jgi:hypothetical protein